MVTLLVEMLTSLPGVGALMIMSQRNYQSSEVYALLVLVGLFGFVVNDLFALIEGAILRRRPRAAERSSSSASLPAASSWERHWQCCAVSAASRKPRVWQTLQRRHQRDARVRARA